MSENRRIFFHVVQRQLYLNSGCRTIIKLLKYASLKYRCGNSLMDSLLIRLACDTDTEKYRYRGI
jgi:hypothetical protein